MSGLSKQHFNAIAEIIKNHINYFENEGNRLPEINCVKGFIEDLSKYFLTQNPLFNENQFKKACLK